MTSGLGVLTGVDAEAMVWRGVLVGVGLVGEEEMMGRTVS